MNCWPVAKGIRRIWRKMFSSSKNSFGYEQINGDYDKENYRPVRSDPQNISSSSFSRISSHRTPVKDINNNTFVLPKRDCHDGCCGSYSSGYESLPSSSSPPPTPFKVFEDELSRSFDSLLLPLQSYQKRNESSIAASSYSYSPLNSFQFADQSSSFYPNFDVDFLSNTKNNHSNQEEVRRDFELNGVTKEIDDIFIPHAASTPMAAKRQHNLNYYQPPMQSKPQQHYRSKPLTQRKKFKPNKKSLEDHCVFCKNNGQEEKVCRSHTVKDAVGRVLCPWLRLYKCPICGEDGDKAHTVKYCPKKPIITPEDLKMMEFK